MLNFQPINLVSFRVCLLYKCILKVAQTIFLSSILCFYHSAIASEEKDWGIAGVVRTSIIPYVSDTETVSTFIPMMFFENEYVFIHGMEGGVYLYQESDWQLSALL